MKKYFIIILTVCIASCQTITVKHESDTFAHFDKETSFYKAISADNVRIKIFKVEQETDENNVPELWLNEIELTLKSRGYKLINKNSGKTDSGADYSTAEFSVYYNGELYRYSVTVITIEKKVYIAEAGGKEKEYLNEKEEIFKIIKSLKI